LSDYLLLFRFPNRLSKSVLFGIAFNILNQRAPLDSGARTKTQMLAGKPA